MLIYGETNRVSWLVIEKKGVEKLLIRPELAALAFWDFFESSSGFA